MPQIVSRLQGFWESATKSFRKARREQSSEGGEPSKHTNVCSQNLGDDTAKKEFNTIKIKHLPIIQWALYYCHA